MLIAPKGTSEAAWRSKFARFAGWTAHAVGSPVLFASAGAIVVVWACTGPLFHFSDTWQLVINTGTTIVTFLMVFVIQNTQNRDSEALQLKLDEIIRALSGAHNALIDVERLTEAELRHLHRHYQKLADDAIRRVKSGQPDTGTAD